MRNVAAREGNSDDEPGTRYVHEQFERWNINMRHLVVDPPDTPEATAAEILTRYHQGLLTYSRRER